MKIQQFSNKSIVRSREKVMNNPSFTAIGEIKVVSDDLDILEDRKVAFKTLFSQYGTDEDTIKILVTSKPTKTEGYNLLGAVIKSSFDGVSETAKFALTYAKDGKLMHNKMNPLDVLYGIVHTMLDLK